MKMATKSKLSSILKVANQLYTVGKISPNLDYCISSIVNFSLPGYNSEVIIRALSYKNIYVSSRSVCSKNSKETIRN